MFCLVVDDYRGFISEWLKYVCRRSSMDEDDQRIAFKEVNPKKQVRIPEKVIEELNLEIDNQNNNGVEFHETETEGEILLKRLNP